jgi:1-phosphofructokinase family hexose kinase
MSVLTVTLNPAIDRVVRLDRFLVGKDHRALSVVSFAGGKGVNLARALKGLGVAAQSMTFLDGQPDKMRTNTTIVDASGRVTRLLEPGVVAVKAEQDRFFCSFKVKIKKCRFVVFSGSLPPGMKPAFLVRLIGLAKEQGLDVAVDTSGEALKVAIKCNVDLVKPNRLEAEELLGVSLSSGMRISKALRTLAGCGIKDVLISLGEDGLAGYDGADEVLAKCAVVHGGHAVGCGDAALAGFVAARLVRKDFKACVRFAAACGAAAARAEAPGGIILKDVKILERKII